MGWIDSSGRYHSRTLVGPRESRDKSVRLGMALAGLATVVVGVATLLPFAWMLLTSFRPQNELFQFPARWWSNAFSLNAYRDALDRLPIVRYAFNSLVVCAGVVVAQLVISALAAYSLARLKPRYESFWIFLMVATLMVPLESLVIPLYLQLRSFPFGIQGAGVNLLDSRWALILPSAVSAFNLFVMRGAFSRLPGEVLDSARIDGASEWRVFFQFVLPFTSPVLTVLGIFSFIATWNAFFWPLVALSNPDQYTLMLGVQKMLETGEPWNIVMAAVSITILPTLVVFVALQRWITRGLALGALPQ